MKAIQISENGGPEVLELKDISLDKPNAEEVTIEHKAIGLNYIDTYHRSGLYPLKLPTGIGAEGAGVITEIGSNIKEFNFSTKTVVVEIFPSYYFRYSKIKPEKKVGYTIENINKSLEFFNSKPLKKNQIIGGPDQDDADSIISSAALRFLSTNKKIWNVPNSSKKEGWIFGV